MINNFIYSYPYLTVLISFLVGWICMPIVLKIAKAKGFVVKPNKRTCHTGEIPNIGGLDIFVSFLLTYMVFEYNHLSEFQFMLVGIFIVFMMDLLTTFSTSHR